MLPPPPRSTLFPYTTLFRSPPLPSPRRSLRFSGHHDSADNQSERPGRAGGVPIWPEAALARRCDVFGRHYPPANVRSEEHTSELQSRLHLVCRLLLEKKKHK